ncbi:hypothetical protein ACNPQM_30175 [Streptomyces sp. NPDC056231]|uniref:hypothetical protein n=1 Tax=Streptomyces sp. NPDC056231 TaxID=3345755 RepID=UPI003AAB0C38
MQKAGDAMLDELARYESDAAQPLCLAAAEEDRLIRLCHVASSFEAGGYNATVSMAGNLRQALGNDPDGCGSRVPPTGT